LTPSKRELKSVAEEDAGEEMARKPRKMDMYCDMNGYMVI
jgi:hypothetical protein